MKSREKQAKLIQQLTEIVIELEWVIAIPDNDQICQGIIVGTPEYVSEIVDIVAPNTTDIIDPSSKSGDKIPDKDPSEDENYH